MDPQTAELRTFTDICEAVFIRRPNRFIVEGLIKDEKITAYLPNPGRLWELLVAGRKLYLTKNYISHGRLTSYTCVAVQKEGIPVLLDTHYTNTVVQWLIQCGKIPDLESYHIVKPEVTFGNSRFDFLLQNGHSDFVLEAKSRTLAGKNIAMFPDAVTLRGERHLIELAELSRRGTRGGVVFLVHWPFARYFMPEYHTDLEFSRTLYDLRKEILIKAVAVQWRDDLTLGSAVRELDIPWCLVGTEAHDCGSYLIVLHLQEGRRIDIGGLGRIEFELTAAHSPC